MRVMGAGVALRARAWPALHRPRRRMIPPTSSGARGPRRPKHGSRREHTNTKETTRPTHRGHVDAARCRRRCRALVQRCVGACLPVLGACVAVAVSGNNARAKQHVRRRPATHGLGLGLGATGRTALAPSRGQRQRKTERRGQDVPVPRRGARVAVAAKATCPSWVLARRAIISLGPASAVPGLRSVHVAACAPAYASRAPHGFECIKGATNLDRTIFNHPTAGSRRGRRGCIRPSAISG